MQDDTAFPTLGDDEIRRVEALGRREDVGAGEFLFEEGVDGYDFILIVAGEVEILARSGGESEVVATHGAGRFLGELSLLTGQRTAFAARTTQESTVIRLSTEQFRTLMANDTDLSDLIFDAFVARRDILRAGAGAQTLRIYGSRFSGAALEIGRYVRRQRLPFQWFDLERDDLDAEAELAAHGASMSDTPIVVTSRSVLKQPTTRELAEHLGLTYRGVDGDVFDVVVVGAGPAGLAASVYGASEGLSTLLVDAVAVGGQAGTSSRIENYLGFPAGLSGGDLVERAAVQAQRLGARISAPTRVVSLRDQGHLQLDVDDGSSIAAHTVVLAMGVDYRRLPIDDLERFEGSGVYYAATEMEANVCGGQPVTVVGGGNSAGQAAIFLAQSGSPVRLVIRGDDLAAKMSRYLVARISSTENIELLTRTNVVGVDGEARLEVIDLDRDGRTERVECVGLFSFIGATPHTTWLPDEVELDERGFVRTDRHVTAVTDLLPFETSMPGVFAAGDVRVGSMKRVAAAVGEGSSVIRSVHDHRARLLEAGSAPT